LANVQMGLIYVNPEGHRDRLEPQRNWAVNNPPDLARTWPRCCGPSSGSSRISTVLNANFGQSQHGVFTSRPGALANDFFVNPARHAQ
jgi:catalase (peroxidase I)